MPDAYTGVESPFSVTDIDFTTSDLITSVSYVPVKSVEFSDGVSNT